MKTKNRKNSLYTIIIFLFVHLVLYFFLTRFSFKSSPVLKEREVILVIIFVSSTLWGHTYFTVRFICLHADKKLSDKVFYMQAPIWIIVELLTSLLVYTARHEEIQMNEQSIHWLICVIDYLICCGVTKKFLILDGCNYFKIPPDNLHKK